MRESLGRWLALDGLRGVAVLMVVADHAGLPGGRLSGPVGVTIFFVLSGFLITRVILRDREAGTWSLRQFFGNRAVRLLPALLALQVVVAAWWVLAGRSVRTILLDDLAATTYVTNIFYPWLTESVLGHTWSLATEEQFYLLWPLLLPLVMRSRRPLTWLTVAVATSLALRLGLGFAGHDKLAYASLPTNAYALLLGCLIAIAPQRVRPGALQRAVPVLALLAITFLVRAPLGLPQIYVVLPVVTVGFAALAVAYALPGSPLLELAPLRFVGRISYAWYLWHVPLLVLTGQTGGGLRALPVVALSLAMATASTFWLEEPLRRRWAARTSRARAPVPARAVVEQEP